ncbi:MAG: collagen-like protein [Paenibacillus sp.]|nr:collagen-like protein [Paenibacillus sp.]
MNNVPIVVTPTPPPVPIIISLGGGGSGLPGTTGPRGPRGETGPVGPIGAQGEIGPQGIVGPIGPIGLTGPAGPIGLTGPQGIQGLIGPQGIQGIQGEIGPKGTDGLQGLQGPAGPQGDTGLTGPQGVQGIQGPTGPSGSGGGGASLSGPYTYNGNPVIQHTSIDITTDTFTAAGHGLTNGTIIFPAWTITPGVSQWGGMLYPIGMAQVHYYVTNATTNTFQISLNNGGAAVDITALGSNSMKFHFQKAVIRSIVISNLGSRNKVKVNAFLFSSLDDKTYGCDIRPNEWPANGELGPNPLGGANFNIGRIGSKGSRLSVTIDGSLPRRSIEAVYSAYYYDNSGG